MFLLYSCAHPIAATSNKVGHDQGKACSRNLLFIIPLGTDASIHRAAVDGDLETISTVDSEGFYTGIYNQTCTVVHGHKAAAKAQ